MKILLIFRFFRYIWFIENIKKNDKVLTLNIVHFPNFEKSAAL